MKKTTSASHNSEHYVDKFKTPDGKIFDTYARKISSTPGSPRFRFRAKQRNGQKEYLITVNFNKAVWEASRNEGISRDDRLKYGVNILEDFALKRYPPDEVTVNPVNIAEYKEIPHLAHDEAEVLIQLYKTQTHPFNFRNPPLSLRLLAQYIKMEEQDTISACKVLKKLGLIREISITSYRFYRLTDKGLKLVENAYKN